MDFPIGLPEREVIVHQGALRTAGPMAADPRFVDAIIIGMWRDHMMVLTEPVAGSGKGVCITVRKQQIGPRCGESAC